MQPIAVPALAPLPSAPDIVVIGAGAAGIGAARRLLAAGLSVAVLEARPRVGGRAVTVRLRGHPVDLGAHWLHAGPVNPLVRLGHARGERLRRAAQDSHLVIGRRFGTPAERAAFGRAFDRADRALTAGSRAEPDRPAVAALPALGPWRHRIATVHGLVSGRPLAEVSLHDFPSLEYGDNWFVAGGYGAYLARLAAGLPIRLGTMVQALDWSGAGVRIATGAGEIRAGAALVTVPIPVLQADTIRFDPVLPTAMRDAIGGFLSGTYEHVVLHWPSAPFRGADRLASLVGGRWPAPGMLTRIDGAPFHYLELDHPTVIQLAAGGSYEARAARFARAVLAEHFGAGSLSDLAIPAVTAWHRDPLARGSWAVVPPGHAGAREALKSPVGERLWFSGEAASRVQWGTVGGAWAEGEAAADAMIAALRRG